MSSVKTPGEMPPVREFGWPLKSTESSYFDIAKRDNGQFTVVLNHALLRGVNSQMLTWWFRHFTELRVTLEDVPGFEGKTVPAYQLWHPSDHLSAVLEGRTDRDGAPIAGETTIHIQEAMQYLKYGWRFPVDAKLSVFYIGDDGWAMGRRVPLLGPVMMLRIHFKDVTHDERHVGVHYHYEVVIGTSGTDPLSRFLNSRITADYGPEFFSAWHNHNVIEVGVFENFLPALYHQRDKAPTLRFARSMGKQPDSKQQTGFDRKLFYRRVLELSRAKNPYNTQRANDKTFL
ncbi:MAG: hypothetical protein AAGE61_09770 [Pseudomonadota bacterium]